MIHYLNNRRAKTVFVEKSSFHAVAQSRNERVLFILQFGIGEWICMTRVAFVGKGGSGKITLASLFSRYLGAQQSAVLAIDADINQHLGEALGLTALES